MSLRIGIDLDGTLADLSAVYHQVEDSLFGTATTDRVEADDQDSTELTDRQRIKVNREITRRRDAVWSALRHTPDLWTTLRPIEEGAVRALQAATLVHDWEIYFITQRPKTAGSSVQIQTQKWLVAQGFQMPAVLTLRGSRGKAAHALDLDFLIDDLPKNCVDVVSDSKCRPILVLREPDPQAELTSQRLNIGVVRSVTEAIELLCQPVAPDKVSAVASILRRLGLSR